ncbi:class I SAM-dependent methyltransferase [Nocardioides sp. InS609-2]|uniref:class I SAM-dependent methyltransferase n=1 Tax=Nocardioides sp. InS609-2 TaxID=2760705 RepID=UPI0020BE66D9|nr:class I SAM-dependent methyltransferase [Nocardioides sp. InS609-2]
MSAVDNHPKRYCPACGNVVWLRNFRPGPNGRPHASCPRCKSLERHRFLAVLISSLKPAIGTVEVLLDVAPSPQTTEILASLRPGRRISLDLGLDGRRVDVLASLTDLPLGDASVDLVFCYHVLEHIPDDRAAMREIARVLTPEGLALVQVPIRFGTVTDEDADTTPEERKKRFGQRDHVRWYGDDFEDRLHEAGLTFQRVTPLEVLGADMCVWLRVEEGEPVWIVRRGTASPARLLGETGLPTMFDALLGELTGAQARTLAARARARRMKARLDRAPVRRVVRRVKRMGSSAQK